MPASVGVEPAIIAAATGWFWVTPVDHLRILKSLTKRVKPVVPVSVGVQLAIIEAATGWFWNLAPVTSLHT